MSAELHAVTAPPESSPLSPYETRVLQMLANGHTQTEISHLLKRSPHTIRSHFKLIRPKMRARNVTHAVAIAIRNGWIA